MVNFLSQPLPDEILHSLMLRNAILSGTKSSRQLFANFFGGDVKMQRLSILLPYNLDKFYSNVNHLLPMTLEQVIEELTVFPFYRNFVSDKTALEVLEKLKGNGKANICAKIGINGSGMSVSKFPKYCPQCAKTDIDLYGQIYWHRVHQLPIEVCPFHNLWLESFQLPIPYQSPYRFYLPRQFEDLRETIFRKNENELVKTISDRAFDVLKGGKLPREKFHYDTKLRDLGYYRGKFLDYPRLIQKTTEIFGHRSVEQLISKNVGKMEVRNYIDPLVHHPEKILNPVRHLFFQLVLESIDPLFLRPTSQFGKGPWVCLNKASDHYLQPIIISHSSKYDTKLKQEVALFKCTCGMIYKRYFRNSRKKWAKRKEVIKIIEYGDVWRQKFDLFLRDNLTSYHISKKLGVDIRLIRSLRIKSQTSVSDVTPDLKGKTLRDDWIKLLKENANGSITFARKTAPEIYRWLYRKDKDWLLSTNKQYAHKEKRGQLSIDWTAVDEDIIQQLQNNYNSFKQNNYRRRISKSLMLRSISGSKFMSNERVIKKLPRSMNYVNSIIEDAEKYQIRKIEFTIRDLKAENIQLRKSLILSKTNLRRPTLKAGSLISQALNENQFSSAALQR